MTLNFAKRKVLEVTQQRLGASQAADLEQGWRNGARTPERAASEPLSPRQQPLPPTGRPLSPEDRPERREDFLDLCVRHARPAAESMRNDDMRRCYTMLVATAHAYAREMSYSPHTTEVTFFAPFEIVADALLTSRRSLYRYVKVWEQQGLIAKRGHRTTVGGQTLADGTLWTVRLRPDRGKRARVRYEHLKSQQWRDLAGDIESGRTAFRTLAQSYEERGEGDFTQLILTWALPPAKQPAPLPMTVPTPREARSTAAILDLRHVGMAHRGRQVDAAARAIARELGDPRSLNWYRHLLWQLLRLLDVGQDLLDTVHLQVLRARADQTEGFARKAGALFLTRLRRSGLLDIIESAPRNRVAARPTPA